MTAPKDGTIESAGFRTGTVTSAQDLRVSLQDVNIGTGYPDEVADQYRVVPAASLASSTWINTGILSSDGTDAGVKRTVTKGDKIAVVIEFAAAAGNVQIAYNSATLGRQTGFFRHYPVTKLGSWAKVGTSSPGVALKYTDGSYPYIAGVLPLSLDTSQNFHLNTTPDEIGCRMVVPFACRVAGLYSVLLAGSEYELVLSDAAGVQIAATAPLDPDIQYSTVNVYPQHAEFATPVTLAAGDIVHVTARSLAATNLSMGYFGVDQNAMLEHLPSGKNVYWAQRTDGGAFTYMDNRYARVGLLIDALDDGTGGSPQAGVPMSRVRLGL